MKSLPKTFLHASYQTLEIGTRLEHRGDNLAYHRVIEEIFEGLRPEGAISRLKAVYLADDLNTLDYMGLEDDTLIYVAEPVGEVQRRDVKWFEKACRAVDEEPFEEDWRPIVERCARSYWAGRGTRDPVHEYLAEAAVIVPDPELEARQTLSP